jgi:lysophospholipase L1-like esterase
MGNEITALVQAATGKDFIGVQGEFGENGQCMTYLKKNAVQSGVNGRAYAATLIEVTAIARLAKAAGKTYGVGAISILHGECDAGNANYESDLHQLWSDYNTDIPAITGQTQKIQMLVSQQNSTNDRAASTLAQWKVGIHYPNDIVCIGPKYQYPSVDGTHLTTDGYEPLGEKFGEVYYQRIIMGNNWQPLAPDTATRSGSVITVRFHVPVMPLVWETTFPAAHPTIAEWKNGKGFEVRTASGRVTINSVAISGDSVQITCASTLAAGTFVEYALTAEPTRMSTPFAGLTRWGQLRDSDPFVGTITKKAQPNYCVAFELTVQ